MTATNWWLRSPNLNNSTNAWNVNSNGNANNNNCTNTWGVRPALMDNARPDRPKGRKPRTIIKGGHIPSNAYAWAADKYMALTRVAVCAVRCQRCPERREARRRRCRACIS